MIRDEEIPNIELLGISGVDKIGRSFTHKMTDFGVTKVIERSDSEISAIELTKEIIKRLKANAK